MDDNNSSTDVPSTDEAAGGRPAWLVPVLVVAVLFAGVMAISLSFAEPPPPKKIRLATGGETGAYFAFGNRLAERLGKWGLEVEVISTAGSMSNYKLLTSDEPVEVKGNPQDPCQVAFIQGGLAKAALPSPVEEEGQAESPVQAIATCYSEPLWLFYRDQKATTDLHDLQGLTINVGSDGSGTQPVARQLLEINGVKDGETVTKNGEERTTRFTTMGDTDALPKFLSGEIDAVVMITSTSAAKVRTLLEKVEEEARANEDPDAVRVRLMSFDRFEAYSRNLPFLSKVELAEGVIDLQANLPSEDVTLLAPKAMLATRAGMHPQIVGLFYKAARDVFAQGNALDPANEYPNLLNADLAIHPAAEEFERNGESWLSRNLPFWAVRLISQLKLALLPLITVLLPAFKLIPVIIGARVQMLLNKHYKALRDVESRVQDADSEQQLRDGIRDIKVLRAELSNVSRKFTGKYQSDLYHWRTHLNLVLREARDRLADMQAKAGKGATADDSAQTPENR